MKYKIDKVITRTSKTSATNWMGVWGKRGKAAEGTKSDWVADETFQQKKQKPEEISHEILPQRTIIEGEMAR